MAFVIKAGSKITSLWKSTPAADVHLRGDPRLGPRLRRHHPLLPLHAQPHEVEFVSCGCKSYSLSHAGGAAGGTMHSQTRRARFARTFAHVVRSRPSRCGDQQEEEGRCLPAHLLIELILG